MRIVRIATDQGEGFHLVDGAGEPLPLVPSFVHGLQARGCSPNTILAYLYDLRRFYQFLDTSGLSIEGFAAAHIVDFLAFLNAIRPRTRKVRVFPTLVRTGLSPMSINRTPNDGEKKRGWPSLGLPRMCYGIPMPHDSGKGGCVSSRCRSGWAMPRLSTVPCSTHWQITRAGSGLCFPAWRAAVRARLWTGQLRADRARHPLFLHSLWNGRGGDRRA
jgi:hypothetical protein